MYISGTRVRNALSSFFISIVALAQAEPRLGKSAVMYAHEDGYCVLQFIFEIMRVCTPNADSNPKSKSRRHLPFIIPNPQLRLGLPALNCGEWVAPIRTCDLCPTDYPHSNISIFQPDPPPNHCTKLTTYFAQYSHSAHWRSLVQR